MKEHDILFKYITEKIKEVKREGNFNEIKKQVIKKLNKYGYDENKPKDFDNVFIQQAWYEFLSKENL